MQDQLSYRIEATLLPDQDRIVARADIHIPRWLMGSNGTARLDLHLDTSEGKGPGQIVIDSVLGFDGNRLAFATRPDSALAVVTIADALGSASIRVFYHLPLEVGYRAQLGYDLYTGVGPGDYWYPDIIGPDGRRERFRTFAVTLRYPAGYAVLTSGAEVERNTSRGVVRATYVVAHVEGFALAAGRGFRIQRIDGGSVPILVFSDSAHAATFHQVGTLAAEAAAWYQRTYGFFPVRQLGILQGYPRAGGGFPLPNVFMIHLRLLDPGFLSWITAHELGHYYWGLHVLGDQERLDWLVLANGIWADQLYMSQRQGRSLAEQWQTRGNGDWIADYLTAVAAGWEQRLGILENQEDSLHFDYNSLIRHGKGATGVYLEAARIGSDRFLALQRRILTEYQFRPFPVADFVRLLDSAGVPKATEFFEAWGRGNARIEAVVDEVELEAKGYRVVVRRTGPVPYPIPFEIERADGRRQRDTLAAEAETDTVRLPERPRSVRLDPDGTVPMWNSGNPRMRSLSIEALDRAELIEPFLVAARSHLAEHAEDARIRSVLAQRLFWLGRYEDVIAIVEPARCSSAEGCRAAITGLRALIRTGRRAEAEAGLKQLEDSARKNGVEAAWSRAWQEATAPPPAPEDSTCAGTVLT